MKHILAFGLLTAALAGLWLTQSPAQQPRQARPYPAQQPGQVQPAPAQQPAQTQPNLDQQFVQHAALGGLAEVTLGKVALERAENADVKKFAQRMVTDHTRANKELMDLAGRKAITLPQQLDKKHQMMVDRLGNMKGADFDRHYMNHMVKDHEEDVAAFQQEAKSGQDAQVKAWAEKTLPTLREHLQLARTIAERNKYAPEEKGIPRR